MFAVVAAIAVLICFLKGRRRNLQYSVQEQPAPSKVETKIKQDLVSVASFTNLAYASSSDLKSEGLRHEIWPIKEMQSGESSSVQTLPTF